MKIYADENIERSIIEGLRRRKIEVVSTSELGYLSKSDEFHLKKASELKAVILTHDIAFVKMESSSDVNHSGIIFSHPKTASIGQCIRGVELIASVLTDEEMGNHIEFLCS